MDKKKVRSLIRSCLIIILSVIVVIVIVKCTKNNVTNNNDEMVTITFDTQGGSEVTPIKIEKGEKLESLPQTFLLGTSFSGWYTDKNATKEFNLDTTIDKDITLYAGYMDTVKDVEIAEETTIYDEDCSPYKQISFISSKKLTEEEFLNNINIEAITGNLPESFNVSITGNIYTLKPVDEYESGKLYKITLPEWISFKDYSESVKEYSFRITKEQKEIVEMVDTIKYVLASEILIYSDEEDANYYFSVTKNKYNEYKFVNDDILCICSGEKKEYDPDYSTFIKVTDVKNIANNYYITATDAQIEEVFSNIDIYFTQSIASTEIIKSLDADEIENEIRNSEAFNNVTTLMAGLVASNETIKENLADTSSSKPDFTQNTYIIDGTLKNIIAAEFLSKAKISVGIGKGHNPNFDSAYTDEFVALRIKFEFDAKIKKKLEIKAELEFTQYLAVSVQGMLDYETKYFEVKWVEFDVATNLYSQTNIDISVMFRSLNSEDAKYKDITEEISEKLSNEDGDANGLVAELQEMLNSEDGYIDLFRAEIINIPIDIIPYFPIFRVNIELDFVVKMNFACGFSSNITVLEAVQVGIEGDSRDKYIGSYKNDLNGGNRYAISLTACGYLGIKAGFEGGISISFLGLSSLGKVGVYIFVGPYVDIYGYCQAEIVKQNNKVTSNLIGGYYIEIGMNLEITLEARSKIFKVKAGVTLLDKKWPLASFGNKDVLVSVAEMEEETIYMGSDNYYATLDVNNLSPLKGNYIDITTGKMNVKNIPWGKVYVSLSDYSFNFDINTGLITYKNLSSRNPDSVECIASFKYIGSYLQFNLSSDASKECFPFATKRIVYYNTKVLDQNSAGKICNVKIYSSVDGVKTLLEEVEVLAGNRVFNYNTVSIDRNLYDNIYWDRIPFQTIVTEDTEFICYGTRKQIYNAFIYYNEATDKWITEVRLSYIGEEAVFPTVPEGKKTKFVQWDVIRNNSVGASTTTNKDITETVWKAESDLKYVTDDLVTMENEDGVNMYVAAARIYIAEYEYDDCELTLISKKSDGSVYTEVQTVPYKGNLISHTVLSPTIMEFKGFALEEDGEVVYEDFYELRNIRDDMTLYLIYEPIYYDVVLKYYDGINSEYVEFATYKLAGGSDISQIDLSEIQNKLVSEDEVEYTLKSYKYTREDSENSYYVQEGELCYGNIYIYPVYSRKVHITFDILDGITIVDLDNIYAETNDNYKVILSNYSIKEADEENSYRLVGWKNMTTSEILDVNAVVYCEKPTTFQAVYEPVQKTYTIEVYTDHGVLLNGEKEFEFTGEYDEYQKYLSQYQNYTPSDVRDDENHITYISKGQSTYNENDKTVIKYNMWESKIDEYTLTIDANGGTLDPQIVTPKTVPWNTEIDLSTILAVKSNDLGTYKIVSWTDSDNNTYSVSDKYNVTKDTKLTANWEIDQKVEYNIKFYLDGKLIKTDVYNKGDKIENISKPVEADGLAFSGWEWYNEGNQKIDNCDTMPSFNIVLKGTTKKVYIIYYVDGEEIERTEGKVGYQTNIKENYVKKGYTVSSWNTNDVSCNNGTFVMPSTDVIFNSTTTINSYKVTYYHNNKVYKEETYNYGTYVSLINVPEDQNLYYAWSSDDVKLQATGFIMPDNNIVIKSISSNIKKYIIYYVNDEIITYDTAIPNEIVSLINITNDNKYAGKTFSGWYIDGVKITDDYIKIAQENVFVYGYFTEGNVKVNIFLDDSSIVLYGNVGETLIPKMIVENSTFNGFIINGNETSEIKITNTSELNVYLNEDKEKYTLSYNISGLIENDSLYETVDVEVNEKVYLPELPTAIYSDYGFIVDGWYSFDGITIKEDAKGKYFIMPQNNVTLNAVVVTDSKEGYEATVYVVMPSQDEAILYRTYYINSDDAPTYFDAPTINGYEFVCYKDQNGNIVDGICLKDMNGENRKFYAYYRKVEMHIIEFVLDGKTAGYRTFYDNNTVEVETFDVPSNKQFSGWMNLYVKSFTMGNKIYFFTGDVQESFAGMDFIFYGYTYDENATEMVVINISDGDKGNGGGSIFVQHGDKIELPSSYFDKKITATAEIVVYNSNDDKSIDITNLITTSEGHIYFTYPSLQILNSYIPTGYDLTNIQINLTIE